MTIKKVLMIRQSCRALVALLVMITYVSVARPDSVNVTGTFAGSNGFIETGNIHVVPIYYSTSSDLSGEPAIAAELVPGMPWFLQLSGDRFATGSLDGNLTISGRITALDLTNNGLGLPLVYFRTATDTIQWIDQSGQTISMPQTGAPGIGSISTMRSMNLQGTFDFGFDLRAPAVPEPGALILLSVGLVGLLPWLRRHG